MVTQSINKCSRKRLNLCEAMGSAGVKETGQNSVQISFIQIKNCICVSFELLYYVCFISPIMKERVSFIE